MLTAPITDASSGAPSSLGASEASLGREDFLRMLIAQLENQDPLNPQESTEFTAQLAQFSSLEQEIAMRDSLDSIKAAFSRGDSVTAIGMIGQEVLAESALFELGQDGALLQFELAGASESTTLDVLDANQRVVATIEAGPFEPGMREVRWNGTDRFGQPVDPGVYTLEVRAEAGEGFVDATPLVRQHVSGADVTGQLPMLFLGQLITPLSHVREVYAPITTGSAP